MNKKAIEKKFSRMGAEVRFGEPDRRRKQVKTTIDIVEDKKRGEHFVIRPMPGDEAVVVNIDAKGRHMLVNLKDEKGVNTKILCGHDERHWFAAQVPNEGVGTVKQAMEALKPVDAHNSQVDAGVKPKNRNKRKNRGFQRQGEFFFVKSAITVDPMLVLTDEPLRMSGRTGGKPHMAQYLYRTGGETMYVVSTRLEPLTERGYRKEVRRNPDAMLLRTWVGNPIVYAKGTIKHADHATLKLDGWHKVSVNSEVRGASVVFLD